jgi:hypothetical protein
VDPAPASRIAAASQREDRLRPHGSDSCTCQHWRNVVMRAVAVGPQPGCDGDDAGPGFGDDAGHGLGDDADVVVLLQGVVDPCRVSGSAGATSPARTLVRATFGQVITVHRAQGPGHVVVDTESLR